MRLLKSNWVRDLEKDYFPRLYDSCKPMIYHNIEHQIRTELYRQRVPMVVAIHRNF